MSFTSQQRVLYKPVDSCVSEEEKAQPNEKQTIKEEHVQITIKRGSDNKEFKGTHFKCGGIRY